MKLYQAVVIHNRIVGSRGDVFLAEAVEQLSDERTITKEGQEVKRTAYFTEPEPAERWRQIEMQREIRPVDYISPHRILCDACEDRDMCDQVKCDCPKVSPPVVRTHR